MLIYKVVVRKQICHHTILFSLLESVHLFCQINHPFEKKSFGHDENSNKIIKCLKKLSKFNNYGICGFENNLIICQIDISILFGNFYFKFMNNTLPHYLNHMKPELPP